MRSLAFFAALLLAVPALAQDEAPKAEAAAASGPAQEKPEDIVKAEKKDEAAKAEPAAEPAAQREEPKDKPRTEEAKPAPQTPKPLSLEEAREAEWRFLKEFAEDNNDDLVEAVAADVEAFIEQRPGDERAAEGLLFLAALREKRGDYKAALVTLARLLYEFPGQKAALQSKSSFLGLADKKLGRKLKAAAGEVVKTPEAKDTADRLAFLMLKLSADLGSALYEPAVAEIRRFQVRFADYREADRIQWALAQLHEKADRHAAALLAYRKILAVYPTSAYRPKAQFAVGVLYAEKLKDYKKAIDAFQEVVAQYPDAPEVLQALERSAELFADRLKQHELAVEMYEKIIALFPKTEAALKAFRAAAKLQRDRLSQPGDAIKTLRRLAEMFPPPPAVEALRDAAAIARRDLKDYNLEIELRKKLAADFAAVKEAADELFAAAEVYEDDLKDAAKAIETYKDVAAKFPGSRAAKRALGAAEKLEKKQAAR